MNTEAIRAALAPFIHDENYREFRYGVIYDDEYDEVIDSHHTFESAVAGAIQMLNKHPKRDVSVTGQGHAILVRSTELRNLFSPETASSKCPVCMASKPHKHSGIEVKELKDEREYWARYNEGKRAEIMRRVESVENLYGKTPRLDAAVAAVLSTISATKPVKVK